MAPFFAKTLCNIIYGRYGDTVDGDTPSVTRVKYLNNT